MSAVRARVQPGDVKLDTDGNGRADADDEDEEGEEDDRCRQAACAGTISRRSPRVTGRA
jgi:hypothetical protein